MTGQFAIQLVGVLATLIWSVSLSFIIIKLVQAVLGLRVSVEIEELGIDAKVHGERGYNI